MITSCARRLPALVLAALAAVVLVGCGGDSDKTPSTSAPVFNETAAQANISSNWEEFFDGKKSQTQRLNLLESASTLRKAIAQQSKNPDAKNTRAEVTAVKIDPSHTTADVTYNLFLKKTKVIDGGVGQAVFNGNTWLVSKSTFCSLARLGSPSGKVPGCA
jgi:hypothetical protein